MWLTDASPTDAIAAYSGALEEAGYTADSESNMGGMIINSYTSPGFTVSVQAVESDSQTSLMVLAEKAD
jgi:hypothetical protein